jgi:lipoprotein NlpI
VHAAAEKPEQLAPQPPVVYRLLSIIYLRQKNYPALVSALHAYIELDADSPAEARAKGLRARAQRQLTNSPEAAVAVK